MRYLVKSPVRHGGRTWPVGSSVDIDERDAELAVRRGRLVPMPSKPSSKQKPTEGGDGQSAEGNGNTETGAAGGGSRDMGLGGAGGATATVDAPRESKTKKTRNK